jgi:hypothetical protein
MQRGAWAQHHALPRLWFIDILRNIYTAAVLYNICTQLLAESSYHMPPHDALYIETAQHAKQVSSVTRPLHTRLGTHAKAVSTHCTAH